MLPLRLDMSPLGEAPGPRSLYVELLAHGTSDAFDRHVFACALAAGAAEGDRPLTEAVGLSVASLGHLVEMYFPTGRRLLAALPPAASRGPDALEEPDLRELLLENRSRGVIEEKWLAHTPTCGSATSSRCVVERLLVEGGLRDVHGQRVRRHDEARLARVGLVRPRPHCSTRDRRAQEHTAIEYPVRSPHDAEGMYDILTYEKGAAVLRMLEQYLGADEFRAGVHAYLSKHAYGNTENTDLWDAIEAATSEPVRRIMDAWIFQGGYPLVRAGSARTAARCALASAASCTRTCRRDAMAGPTAHPAVGRWSVDDDPRVARRRAARPAAARPRRGRARERRRSRLPPSALRAALLDRLAGPALAEMSTIERYNLVDDAWAAVLAGESTAASS